MKNVAEFSRYRPNNDKEGRSNLKTQGYRKKYQLQPSRQTTEFRFKKNRMPGIRLLFTARVCCRTGAGSLGRLRKCWAPKFYAAAR